MALFSDLGVLGLLVSSSFAMHLLLKIATKKNIRIFQMLKSEEYKIILGLTA
ncbi:MAG: hypothetical protein MZV64_16155 [Ignavibacteriales bacterium]|nr:hypothetical protein [Ignavibacteriales bacterium]